MGEMAESRPSIAPVVRTNAPTRTGRGRMRSSSSTTFTFTSWKPLGRQVDRKQMAALLECDREAQRRPVDVVILKIVS